MRRKKSPYTLSAELLEFADSIGTFIEYFGFKSIHGRCWALLYLADRPLAAMELGRYLRVSKTLVSFATSELLDYQVIQVAGQGTGRTMFYRANPDIAGVILNVLRNRELPLLGEIGARFARLEKKPPTGPFGIEPGRQIELGLLIGAAQIALVALLQDTQSPGDLSVQFRKLAEALG